MAPMIDGVGVRKAKLHLVWETEGGRLLPGCVTFRHAFKGLSSMCGGTLFSKQCPYSLTDRALGFYPKGSSSSLDRGSTTQGTTMYGMKSEDIDKIGYTILYSLLHIFIISVASTLFCSICQYSQRSLSIALFFCGYVTNTFIRTDIKEIWRE